MPRWPVPVVLAAILTLSGHACADTLNAPFNPAYSREVAGRPAPAPFACRPVPQPTLDMSGLESRYAKNDPTQSKVDPAMAAREAARGKVLWDYVTQLGRMADQYMLSNPARPEIADCIAQHLAAWGRANALTQNIEQNHEIGRHQAIMLQAWSLAGMTFAYMKLDDRQHTAADRDILQWFRTLSDSVVREYSDKRSRWYQKRANNHGLWAGLAVANAGIILNDRAKLDFGLSLLRDGLATVAQDGSLPEEMARGERAMLYQHFGTMAIMGLVAVADANGRGLGGAEQQALERLVRFNIAAGRTANTSAPAAAGPLPKHVDKSALAWADIAICHFAAKNPALAGEIDAYARPFRPLSHIYYGGNATAAFNPAALSTSGDKTGRCPSARR
jgi:poly(beta-D-mannuronate) lyase